MIRPIRYRIACKILPFKNTSSIVLRPELLAPFGRTATGFPHRVGKVLALGDKVTWDIKVGDYVLLEGMNLDIQSKLDVGTDDEIGIPYEKAVLGVLPSKPDCVE